MVTVTVRRVGTVILCRGVVSVRVARLFRTTRGDVDVTSFVSFIVARDFSINVVNTV